MTIRTQSLVSILPVFLFLAVVSSGLLLKTEREEYLWGLREEASSLAVATAEFISAHEFLQLAADGTGAPGYGRVTAAIDRILKRESEDVAASYWRHIYGVTPDGRRVLFCRDGRQAKGPAPTDSTGPLLPSAGELTALRRGDGFALALRQRSGGQSVMTAYAPVRDASGEVAGIVGVETDAQGMETLTRVLLTRSLLGIGAVLLLGAGATMAVSGVVAREVRDLRTAAVRVTDGDLDRPIEAGRIQELGDLCNTFNTMNELLKDVLAKTKRSLLEGEQFRDSSDLARAFSEQCWPPLRVEHGAACVVARRIGALPGGSFYAAFEIDGGSTIERSPAGPAAGGVWALVGRLRDQEEHPKLQTVVAASAACSLLTERLRAGDPARAIADVCNLFPLEQLDALLCRGRSIEKWTLDGRAAVPPGESCFVLHTLGSHAQERIARYAGFFGCSPPASPCEYPVAELLEDMAAIQTGAREGCLMIVKTGGLPPVGG